MASLNSALTMAVQSLGAATDALQVTNNNIANANTPGYTRQIVVEQEAAPISEGNLSFGQGVEFEGFQSVRNELLNGQIQQQTTAQSGANAQLSSLQPIQSAFTTSTQDIGTEMSALFSSLSSLSTSPSSSNLRQGVLSAGESLANAFNTVSDALTSQQAGINTQVSQDVSQINELTQQIAALNPQIIQAGALGQDAGTLQDQQDQLIQKLSSLTGISVANTESGVTLTTNSGTLLVSGAQSLPLKTTIGSNGFVGVTDGGGNDITAVLSGPANGNLGGSIYTRDTTISGLLNQLDSLASQFATAFNAAQAKGFDQNGNQGQNFFTIPSTTAGAAAAIKVAISDPALIAASSDGTSGSNGNLANFSAVQSTAMSSGQTPGDAYSALVYQVGSVTANATSEQSATTSSLTQLNSQLSSQSGVSLDEESANLLMYQQSYEAAARVVTTVQALFSVTLSMGTASAA